MSNKKAAMISALVIVGLLGVAGYVYFGTNLFKIAEPGEIERERDFDVIARPTRSTEQTLEERPDIAEVYEEDDVIEIDSENYSGAIFDRFEGGRVYYFENDSLRSKEVSEELLVTCTLQVLTDSDSFDANLVVSNKRYSAQELGVGIIERGEPVIVIVNAFSEDKPVYKVVVNEEGCPVE